MCPNTKNYGSETSQNLDTFHPVRRAHWSVYKSLDLESLRGIPS